MYRTEKAARITMVKNVLGCPCLVVDGIFAPNSYVYLMYLYVIFLSNRYLEQ